MEHSCRFLLVTPLGPDRIIGGHPTEAAVSDALGGAIPTPVYFGRPLVSAWVRETCATEGAERNPVASILARTMGSPWDLPFTGPVVFTGLAWARTGAYLSAATAGITEDVADGLAAACRDVRRAMAGFDDGFESDGLNGVWADRARAAAERARQVPIPDGWPHGMGINPPDAVSDLFRRLGLGAMFAPIETMTRG